MQNHRTTSDWLDVAVFCAAVIGWIWLAWALTENLSM